jgi:hypothetical protein
MIFRRIIINSNKITNDDILHYLNSDLIKLNYPYCNTQIKPSKKENICILDVIGEGADGLSKRLKIKFTPYSDNIKVKKEKKLTPLNNHK